MKTPKYAFMGSPEFAVTILKSLIKNGWRPDLVITEPDKPVSRHKVLTPTPVSVFAKEYNLQIAKPQSKEEITQAIKNRNLDIAIVAAYGQIIPQEALNIPKFGMVNVHASLLPKYRGASPIQAAILNGDKETGISFMIIEPSLDSGPVLKQESITLNGTETTPEITKWLADLSAKNIKQVIEDYIEGNLKSTTQDDSLATYAPKVTKTDGAVRLSKESPIILDRKFRAYQRWPGIYTLEFGPRLLIKGARLDDQKNFIIKKLQWEGKKEISSPDFSQTYPEVLTKLPKCVIVSE